MIRNGKPLNFHGILKEYKGLIFTEKSVVGHFQRFKLAHGYKYETPIKVEFL